MSLGRGQRVITEAKKINVVDLVMQGGRSGPNQCAHAAIADGQAIVRARRGSVEREIGVRDQTAVIVVEQTLGGLSSGRSNSQRNENEGRELYFHIIAVRVQITAQ